jgi:hypothetical protein
VSGGFFHHKKESPHNPEADDVLLQEGFISLCEELTGVSFPTLAVEKERRER